MIHEVQVGRACGEAFALQSVELSKANGVIVKIDQELTSINNAWHFEQAASREWEARFHNQEKLTKEERKKHHKWKVTTYFAAAVIVGMVVFNP